MNSSTGNLFYEKVDFSPLSLGTVLYGTLVDYKTHNFVAENIFFYEGRSVENLDLVRKCALFLEIMRAAPAMLPNKTRISIAPMWSGATPPHFYCAEKTYQILDLTAAPAPERAVQAKKISNQREPMKNPAPLKNKEITHPPPPPPLLSAPVQALPPPQQRVFFVKADLMNDIYHLYVKTDKERPTENNLKYHSIAFIPDYKTSVFMNKIFRKIRENDNLDYIEESDDEDFEDTRYDKYVHLDKIQRMMCKYNTKFRKWSPIVSAT